MMNSHPFLETSDLPHWSSLKPKSIVDDITIALEKAEQGKETGFPLEEARTVVRELGSKWEPVLKEVVQYQTRIMDYLVDSGIIKRENGGKKKCGRPGGRIRGGRRARRRAPVLCVEAGEDESSERDFRDMVVDAAINGRMFR